MPRKLTNQQRAWLIDYARATSFEAMSVDDYLSGEIRSFAELQDINLVWFQDWARETLLSLRGSRRSAFDDPLPPIIGFYGEGYGENCAYIRADHPWVYMGMFSIVAGSDLFPEPVNCIEAFGNVDQLCTEAYYLGREAINPKDELHYEL